MNKLSNPSVDCFSHPYLRKAAQVVLENPFYDEERHHGALYTRYREKGIEEMLAAVAASIQCGYFPEWIEMPHRAYIELLYHCGDLEEKPWYNQNHFAP